MKLILPFTEVYQRNVPVLSLSFEWVMSLAQKPPNNLHFFPNKSKLLNLEPECLLIYSFIFGQGRWIFAQSPYCALCLCSVFPCWYKEQPVSFLPLFPWGQAIAYLFSTVHLFLELYWKHVNWRGLINSVKIGSSLWFSAEF